MMMDDSDDEFVPEAEQPQKPWRPPKEPKEKVLVASQAKVPYHGQIVAVLH